jgi:hypothetical protein
LRVKIRDLITASLEFQASGRVVEGAGGKPAVDETHRINRGLVICRDRASFHFRGSDDARAAEHDPGTEV